MNQLPLIVAVIGLGVLALPSAMSSGPLLVWNASPSVPIGLYRVVPRPPSGGALAVLRLAEPFRTLADVRGYVPASVPIIKPIAAFDGDTVCRYGAIVSINGRLVALARNRDVAGRLLPRWRGCRRLDSRAIFLISRRPDSFDSRYFGPVDRSQVMGIAIPLWTMSASPDPMLAGRTAQLYPATQCDSACSEACECSVSSIRVCSAPHIGTQSNQPPGI